MCARPRPHSRKSARFIVQIIIVTALIGVSTVTGWFFLSPPPPCPPAPAGIPVRERLSLDADQIQHGPYDITTGRQVGWEFFAANASYLVVEVHDTSIKELRLDGVSYYPSYGLNWYPVRFLWEDWTADHSEPEARIPHNLTISATDTAFFSFIAIQPVVVDRGVDLVWG